MTESIADFVQVMRQLVISLNSLKFIHTAVKKNK